MELTYYNVEGMEQAQFEALLAEIDPQNRARIQQMAHTDSAKLSLAAHLLARRAVSARSGTGEQNVVILRDENGKPYTERPGVFFSLTHCPPYAVCVCSDIPVGVDIERLRPIQTAVLRKVCAAGELERFFGYIPGRKKEDTKPEAQTPEDIRRFFALWCLKESYAKLRGAGLFPAAREIVFSAVDPVVCSNRQDIMCTLDYKTLPGYVIATAEERVTQE